MNRRINETNATQKSISGLSRLLILAIGVLWAGALHAQSLKVITNVVVRKPPTGYGLVAPNNGGLWVWGNEILVMYLRGYHSNNTACSSHSTIGTKPGVTYDTSRSLDGGVTWSDHRVAFKWYTEKTGWPDPQPVALTTPLDFSNPNTILNFQRDDAGKTYFYISTNRGTNWSGPYNNIPQFLSGVYGRTMYYVTGPGSLTAYMEMHTSNTATCFRIDSYAVHTSDGGLTWTLGAKISSLPPCGSGKLLEWDTHPSVARIDANTLIASFRSGNQTSSADRTAWFDATRSTDNGATWSHLIKLADSPRNNGCPSTTVCGTLTNGIRRVVALMWRRPPDTNACANARLFARYSDDNGATWSGEITLRNDAYGWDTGYPIGTVRTDGKIVVCYYMKTVNQNEPNYIAATIVDAGFRAEASGTPAAPSGLTATAVSSNQINLAWTDNATNETGFKIERKTGAGGTWAQIATVGVNATSYTNTGLTPNMAYYYRVAATNSAGVSAWSNEANATTPGSEPVPEVCLPKTGQTQSWRAGDDGDLRKGVAWPTPRFTDNGNGTVTDNLTGLIWLKKADNAARTWTNALNFCNSLANGISGLTDGSVVGDWRLPNINELRTLVSFGAESGPTLPAGHPFSGMQSVPYWSSTPRAGTAPDQSIAVVDFGNGLSYAKARTSNQRFLAVRGSGCVPKTGRTQADGPRADGELRAGVAWPSPRFTDFGNGAVRDNLTGLVWTKNANPLGNLAWTNAVAACRGLASGSGGLSDGSVAGDWRLPNLNEMRSLMDFGMTTGPQLPAGHPFTGVVNGTYWTSTRTLPLDGKPIDVNFSSSGSTEFSPTLSKSVWPVRDGVELPPPAPPSGLTATAVSSNQINLSWTDNANNEDGFKIERKTGAGGSWAQIAALGANAASYTNTGLAAGTTYYYRVAATNSAGSSAWSNEANATTPGGGGEVLSFTPTADTKVNSAMPTNNYGTNLSLSVQQSATRTMESYLRFSVSGLGGRTVTDARLRLKESPTDSAGTNNSGISVRAITGSWTELGTTWNNRPSYGSVSLGEWPANSITNDQVIEIQLTSGHFTGDGTYELALIGTSDGNDVGFKSREQAADRPQLILTVGGGQPPVAARFVGWAWQVAGGLLLSATGGVNQVYILQGATNLTPPVVWQPIATNTASGGAVQFLDSGATNHPQRYYRAVTP